MDRYLSKKLSLLRFLAVASVIVYHAYPFAPGEYVLAPPAADSAADFAQGYVSLALARWALPFLGLVSGYLFFRTLTPTLAGFVRKMRRRVRTLLVPFLIWSGLGVLFCVAVAHSPYADVSPYWTVDTLGEALDRWLLHPVIYPLWFLQALVVCVVLSPLIYLLIRWLKGWTLAIAAIWWATGWQPEALQPWISATAFPTFIAGAVIAQRGWRAPWRAEEAPAWAAATCVAAWLAGAALFALYGHALARVDEDRAARRGRPGRPGSLDRLRRAQTAPEGLSGSEAAPGVVAALLFVAPLSFFVYVTQEPPLSVLQDLPGARRARACRTPGLRAAAAARDRALGAGGAGAPQSSAASPSRPPPAAACPARRLSSPEPRRPPATYESSSPPPAAPRRAAFG